MALASLQAKLPAPFGVVEGEDTIKKLAAVIKDNNVATIVIGLPQNLSGYDTQQTAKARRFIEHVKAAYDIPVFEQDEALSSVRAEEELSKRGVSYNKSDIDALAAAYILEDYLRSESGENA